MPSRDQQILLKSLDESINFEEVLHEKQAKAHQLAQRIRAGVVERGKTAERQDKGAADKTETQGAKSEFGDNKKESKFEEMRIYNLDFDNALGQSDLL